MSCKEMTTAPFVSIVICTYNRRELLKDCLTSVFSMEYPKSCYEVVIVDGGSNDGTDEIRLQFPQIKFLSEARFGLAYARNKGAELARGSVVAFTDDDCLVDKYWLKNLVLGLQRFPHVVGVGGPVFPAYPQTIPKKILVKPALGLFDEGRETKLADGIITSNAAFRREIFSVVQFDDSLGTTRRGKLILCGEDVDFCKSITESNRKLLYMPSAKVYHQIHNDRIRVAYIVKHAAHKGISRAKSFKKTKDSRIWMIRFAVGGLVQSLSSVISNKSFTTCYKIIASLSALFICTMGLDEILFRN